MNDKKKRGLRSLANARKPYSPPKLRKLDPRCARPVFSQSGALTPFTELVHVENCACEKRSDS